MDERKPRVVDLPADAFGSAEPAIVGRDLRLVAVLLLLLPLAWLCPDRLCARLCRAFCKLQYRLRPSRYQGGAGVFRLLQAETGDGALPDRMIPEALALRQLERLQLLRYHRPGGWRPRVRLRGEAHLERALAEGRGAILWVAYGAFSDMMSKIALHEAGYPVWHLSRHTHGHFSWTRFGLRVLNPIRIAVERRFLADRVVIDPAAPKLALRRLAEHLDENRVVSITLWVQAGRVTMVPFRDTELALPGGPAALALKSGAALLPVFTERNEDGTFTVTIEAPLNPGPDETADASREARVAGMLTRQSALMDGYFRRLPSQYHFSHLHIETERLRKHLAGAADPDTP